MLRKLTVHEYVSADGFATGPDGDLDWLAGIGGDVDQVMLREMDDIDAGIVMTRYRPVSPSRT
jgi:hypothetical protein